MNPTRQIPPMPDTTDDPLAQELGYNSIPVVQKVIRRATGRPAPQQFAGGQLGSQELQDRLDDIRGEVNPTYSDLDRAMDPAVSRYFNQSVPPLNIPVPNSANVDPIARPPGTVERIEDIDN